MEPGVSLRTYQIGDLAFYIANPKCLNLSEPSTGKTPSVAVMTQYVWQEHQHRTCWVQPKSIMRKNRDEILRFTDFKPEEVAILDGPPKKIDQILSDPKIKVWLCGFDRYSSTWKRFPSDMQAVFVDEIHKGYKGMKSARTIQFVESMNSKTWFIGMTGTLVDGRLDSAYPAIRVIEPRYYASYEQFMWYHAVKDIDGNIVGWKNTDKLAAIFGRHGIRHTFEEVYGKQAVIIQTELIDMSDKHRKMYEDFEDNALLELDRFFVDGTEPGVGFMRARQIMEHPNSFPDLETGVGFTDILNGEIPGKEERLDIHLEDHERTGKPLVIFASMVPQQERILKMVKDYGMTVELINGSVSAVKRGKIDAEFKAGRIQVLVCSPEVADVGFNWQYWGNQEVDHFIFVTLNFLDTTFLQAFRRGIRGVRKTHLLVTVFEYKNCRVEQRIFEIVRRKSVLANRVDPSRPIFDLSRNSIEEEAA